MLKRKVMLLYCAYVIALVVGMKLMILCKHQTPTNKPVVEEVIQQPNDAEEEIKTLKI